MNIVMTKLAIRGHKTRGKEVIEILEMLGGKNAVNYDGSNTKSFYFLNNIIICSSYGSGKLLGIDCYTLEEFLEKFPYKIGDKAFAFGNKCTIIDAVWDGSIKEMVYTIKLDTSKYTTTKLSNQLQPYKEEIMDKANKAVFDANAQCCDIINRLVIGIPKGYEFAGVDDDKQQVVFEKVTSKYPKTYRECAEIVGFNIEEEPTIFGYKEELLDRFQKLLICRDAYWKIAGEQMDLGRPWNQDYDDRCFIIANNNGNIHTYEYHGTNNVILAFPTAEMRDAFYENFKDLIIECMKLL
jgi:hypothetical protein